MSSAGAVGLLRARFCHGPGASRGGRILVPVAVTRAHGEGVVARRNLRVGDRRGARAPAERVHAALEGGAVLAGAEAERRFARLGARLRPGPDPRLRRLRVGHDLQLHRGARDAAHPQRLTPRARVADDPSHPAVRVRPADGHPQDAPAHHAAGAVAADPAALPAVPHQRRAQHPVRIDTADAERDGLHRGPGRLEEDRVPAGGGRGRSRDERQQRGGCGQPQSATCEWAHHDDWCRHSSRARAVLERGSRTNVH